ncbi:hypothetical protein C0J52_17050 [Blattella germanica]|nr:hypothetical protein C0J52_17050 [Blattella germanica]
MGNLHYMKRKTQQVQNKKRNLPTIKRKRDTSHGTRKKHQLQLFKNFWNDTFENSIPSINLNISTILICFRFTPCLEDMRILLVVEQNSHSVQKWLFAARLAFQSPSLVQQ